MPHFFMNKQAEEKLVEMVGKDNPLMDDVVEKESRQERMENFEAVDRLRSAACSAYVEDGMSWDEMVGHLEEAIGKLKGKEAELKAIDEEADSGKEDEEEYGA